MKKIFKEPSIRFVNLEGTSIMCDSPNSIGVMNTNARGRSGEDDDEFML